MSRFVDKNATFQFDLGECQCPPGPEGAKPHARDEASIRKELSYGEVLKLAQSSDEIEASMQLMLMRVKSWSLRDSEGHPVPVSRQARSLRSIP